MRIDARLHTEEHGPSHRLKKGDATHNKVGRRRTEETTMKKGGGGVGENAMGEAGHKWRV